MRSWRARGRRRRSLNRWHRRAGLTGAAILVLLVGTGVPLQFTDQLDLGGRHIAAGWILDWYGLSAPEEVVTSAGVVGIADRLYREDGTAIAELASFRGAVRMEGLTIAAGAGEVLLLDGSSGEVLDRFYLLEQVLAIGEGEGRVWLQTEDGKLVADRDLLTWQAPETPGAAAIRWAVPRPAPGATAAAVRQGFRATMLSVERLLQDLHSGRLFGVAGILIVDAASLLLLFLTVSGLLMWWRGPRL